MTQDEGRARIRDGYEIKPLSIDLNSICPCRLRGHACHKEIQGGLCQFPLDVCTNNIKVCIVALDLALKLEGIALTETRTVIVFDHTHSQHVVLGSIAIDAKADVDTGTISKTRTHVSTAALTIGKQRLASRTTEKTSCT